MDEVKVSVVVPVYNAAAYIHKCLDSILNQTLREIEVICVDDKSTDNSLQILKEYEGKDSRMHVIQLKETGAGAAHARNAGMALSKGKYLSILDADDFFALTMLERLYDKAEKHDTDIVICDAHYYDNATGKINIPWKILNKQALPNKAIFSYRDTKDQFFQMTVGTVWNMLLRRSFVFEHELQFQALNILNDIFFTFMASIKAKRISVVNERLVYYRTNNKSSQQGMRANWPDGYYKAFLGLKKALTDEMVYEDIKRSFVNMALEYNLEHLNEMNSWDTFSSLWFNLREKYFHDLDISGHSREYFYDSNLYEQYEAIMQISPEQWVYGNYWPLRKAFVSKFPFPEKYIPKGSKMVLYGAGELGKAYYAQLFFSRYCEIVLWVDQSWESIGFPVSEISKILEVQYDIILIAAQSETVANEIKENLLKLGVLEEKIVIK